MKRLTMRHPASCLAISPALQSPELSLHSPALLGMRDFSHATPFTLDQTTPLEQTRALFERAHLDLCLVVDDRGQVSGLLSRELISKQNEMLKQANGYDRAQLTAHDMMLALEQLWAIEADQLADSTVGQLLKTLEAQGVPFCLVTEQRGQNLRGFIDARDLAHKAQADLTIQRTPSFAKLYRALHV